MGLLKINKTAFNEMPEVIDAAMKWLKKECNAEVTERFSYDDRLIEFSVRGDGVPLDNETFDITCTMIVDKVLMFNIGWPDDYNTNT